MSASRGVESVLPLSSLVPTLHTVRCPRSPTRFKILRLMSNIAFTLRGGTVTQRPPVRFGPRLGQLLVTRTPDVVPTTEPTSAAPTEQEPSESPRNLISIETPGVLASTSRGVVPHLSRDHVLDTRAIRGVHITYDSLLVLIGAELGFHTDDSSLHAVWRCSNRCHPSTRRRFQ